MSDIRCDQDGDLMVLVTGEHFAAVNRWPPAGRRWRRLLVTMLTAGGLAMIPWLVALGWFLPRTATAPHWNVAWVGLDGLEAAGLFVTGRLMRRGDLRYTITATLTGTALLIDAWFDVLTAASRGDLLAALLMACVAELPVSGLCFFLALRGSREAHARAPSGEAGGYQGQYVVGQGIL
jgi:hypothetical protein